MFATWTFISIGRRVTQKWKFAFRLRGDSILLFKGQKKTLEIYDFQSSESYQGDIHSSSFFLFSTLAVPERLWQRRSHSLQQGSNVTPCPAVGPSVPFLCTFCFFVEHRRRSPFFKVFPCSIHLLSTSNNGSIGFIPQTTSKMISLSHSKGILFVVDLGQLEPFVGIIFDTTDSMCNVCIFRNVKEVLVRDVNTPPHPQPPLMIIRQHVQHVKNSKKSNPIPPFPQASFLKFATLPRDRKWHISKLATLPRAPYQPHA